MNNIAIVYTSTISKTQKICDSKNTFEVKLYGSIGDNTYKSGDITLTDYLDELESKSEFAKTSQPSSVEFIELFTELLKKYEHVICLTPSENLSGTYSNALVSSKKVDENNIKVIDTKAIAMSETIAMEKTIDLIDQGKSIEEIVKIVDELTKRLVTYAVPGSLNYLARSGRVNMQAAKLGTLLQVKVLVRVIDGQTGIYHRGRGDKSIAKKLINDIEKFKVTKLYYTSINETPESKNVYLNLFKEKNIEVIETFEADIVPASHFGPQSLGFTIIRND